MGEDKLADDLVEVQRIVRDVLGLGSDAPVTSMRMMQAMQAIMRAERFANEGGRILDQMRALLSAYDRYAVEDDKEPSSERFPDVVRDYQEHCKLLDRAVRLTKYGVFLRKVADDNNPKEIQERLEKLSLEPHPVRHPSPESRDTSPRSPGTPEATERPRSDSRLP